MLDVQAALRSLYDSLNSLFTRMGSSDDKSMEVARIMLRIGEIEQTLAVAGDEDEIANHLHRFAGAISMSNPDDADDLATLLEELDVYLSETFSA